MVDVEELFKALVDKKFRYTEGLTNETGYLRLDVSTGWNGRGDAIVIEFTSGLCNISLYRRGKKDHYTANVPKDQLIEIIKQLPDERSNPETEQGS